MEVISYVWLQNMHESKAGHPHPGSPHESLPEGCEELRRSEAVESSDIGEGKCQGLVKSTVQ